MSNDVVMPDSIKTSPKPSPKQSAAPTPHKTWTEGDLQIISSDNVSFRVERCMVAAGSKVLRDMMEGPNGKQDQITFTDESFETEYEVGVFISLCHGALPAEHVSEGTGHLLALLEFLDKYDCEMPRQVFISTLWGHLHCHNLTPKTAFILAARLDQTVLVNHIMQKFQSHVFAAFEPNVGVQDKSAILSIYEGFNSLPRAYQFALWSAGKRRMQGQSQTSVAVTFAADLQVLVGLHTPEDEPEAK